MKTLYQRVDSPAGSLFIASQGDTLCAVAYASIWKGIKNRCENLEEGCSPVIKRAKVQLAEYFKGKRRRFDLPLAFYGTEFQTKVWKALSEIPYGKTWTYADQAKAAQTPKAVRAVGRTNGSNPFCIVLPCHRVIGSTGALTGYAGGLTSKRYLLALEGATLSA